MPLDPHRNTRKEFIDQMQSAPLPQDADPEWLGLATKLQKLAGLLGYHEAMQPNINQTYMTPAASKNRVYFMWDFVSRTLGNLLNGVPYSLQGMNSKKRETWSDCKGRSKMAKDLILDTNKGMLDMMMESTYPGQTGEPPTFGDEVLAVAREL